MCIYIYNMSVCIAMLKEHIGIKISFHGLILHSSEMAIFF